MKASKPDAAGVTVHSFRSAPGELRATVEAAGGAREIWIRSSLAEPPGADAMLALTLMPAMVLGGRLEIDAPVDESLLRWVPEIDAILRAFQLTGDWTPAVRLKHRLELICPVAPATRRSGDRGVAAFFSGGVDSFNTLRRNPEIDRLVYVAGMDAPVGPAYDDHHARARAAVARVAEQLGLSVLEVATNARDLYTELDLAGPTFGGGLLGAAARSVAADVSRLYLASSQAHRWLLENSSHPMLDPLWGRGALELIHDGAELSRAEKLEQLIDDPLAQAALRPCWAGTGKDYNCCRCEKCLRTMVALETLGALDQFETFPEPLDLEAVAATRPGVRHELAYWIENLELAVAHRAAAELIGAIEVAIANAGPRELPTPRRAALLNPKSPDQRALYMAPDARLALDEHRTVVFLVGGFDGTRAQPGDLLELRAAIEAIEPLGEDVAAVPVVSLDGIRSGEVEAGSGLFERLLVFTPAGEADERTAARHGLIPATLPARIERAATYFYGGAYLNRFDADRVLNMAEAVDRLGRWAGVSVRPLFASGLAIEPEWARAAGMRWRALLGRAELLRLRDPLSYAAATHLADAQGRPARSLSGDDTVALIERSSPSALEVATDPTRALRINLDATEPAPTADCEAALDLARKVVWTLDSLGELPSDARQVRLDAIRLDRWLTDLRSADLTITGSHHVALASLMLGVPAVVVCSSGAGGRSAEGLRRDFSIPAELLPTSASEPTAVASAAIAWTRPGSGAADLRTGLEAGRRAVLARRRVVEEDLRAALDGNGAERAPDPRDEDYRRLLRVHQRLLDQHEVAEREANARQDSLEDLSDSTSWRLTAPLRATGRLLRRR